MQIKISFTSEKDIILPIHHNNIVQGFIYNNIDKKLAKFLHEKGFSSNNRNFKLFSFSNILKRGRIEKDKFNFGNKIEIIVSSPLEDFCKSIANHMLQSNSLFIGKNLLKVEQIEIINYLVESEEIIIDTLSPIVVYSTLLKQDGSKFTLYFTPKEKDFSRIVSENIIRKYNALNNRDLAFKNGIEIFPIGETRQNITYYKNFLIKGVSGKFKVRGNIDLLQLGIDSGFGSKNSQGFGCVKYYRKEEKND